MAQFLSLRLETASLAGSILPPLFLFLRIATGESRRASDLALSSLYLPYHWAAARRVRPLPFLLFGRCSSRQSTLFIWALLARSVHPFSFRAPLVGSVHTLLTGPSVPKSTLIYSFDRFSPSISFTLSLSFQPLSLLTPFCRVLPTTSCWVTEIRPSWLLVCGPSTATGLPRALSAALNHSYKAPRTAIVLHQMPTAQMSSLALSVEDCAPTRGSSRLAVSPLYRELPPLLPSAPVAQW